MQAYSDSFSLKKANIIKSKHKEVQGNSEAHVCTYTLQSEETF